MPNDFKLDPFQEHAIGWIQENQSVLVSAPTGSGKTLIAQSAVDQALSENKTVIYTAPIKALSNQKYRDFRQDYGDDQVGILTGDVSINPDAPIVIMTTEIYRNSLFENSKRLEKLGWIIFDEVHYLDDWERGTVWEEALLFTPPEVNILALSATIPNIQELADWISSIHDRHIQVVKETHRPVPLQMLYHCQGKIMEGLKRLKQDGYWGRNSWRLTFKEKKRGKRMPRSKPNRLDHLLDHLQRKDRLPVVYFVFGRKRAQELAWEAIHFDFLNQKERKKIFELYDDLLDKYDLQNEKTAQDIRPLIEQGIAFHHAGMLPTLKEVIEQLFTSRLIKAIFTTETFALGINMPARSVVLDELEKYSGMGFRLLTTRDFYQMAGRAGRRGLDPEGFVYSRILPHNIDFKDVEKVIFGKPEEVQSQFNTTYATLLNLYSQLGKNLTEIYPRTFHSYQSGDKKRRKAVKMIERKLDMLEEMEYITPEGVTEKGEFASSLFGYELMLAELRSDGVLDGLSDAYLAIVLGSLIFEPRKNDHHPKLTKGQVELEMGLQHYSRLIYRKESKYSIRPYTKRAHFHLSLAIEAWVSGAKFDDLFELTTVDEGELVRYFRMIIQLLRELAHNQHSSETLKANCFRCLDLINRDVVDAEKQLRV